MTHDTLIKGVSTNRYELELFETASGLYMVRSQSLYGINDSEPVRDYKLASDLFELKYDELEGN